MTPSLRMRVVEAGARKICYERDHPSELTEYPYGCRACVVLAEETLDAMLDCLAENENKFEPASFRMVVADLVRLLREDR